MKKTIVLLMILCSILVLAACGGNVSQREEQAISETRQQRLLAAQPPPEIVYSLERENLIKRTVRFNDPNKISYIYMLSDMGQIYAFYTIKGKVSSVNSALTTPDQIVWRSGGGSIAVASPQEDGSYGSNGDAIFFYTTEDVYVEWNGKYLLADQPLQLTEQPLMIANE